MMEEIVHRPSLEYIPPLPPKVKQTTFTQINGGQDSNGYSSAEESRSLSSMRPLVLNSKTPTTVFIEASERDETDARQPPARSGRHVVTIRINNDADKPKTIAPKISSVHLKSDNDYESFKLGDFARKSSTVRLNVEETLPKILESNELQTERDRPPYIYCSSYTSGGMVMSSGQCSPSDTLDSGTCSDLDSTPPPLPKKKTTKTGGKKAVTVTLIGAANNQGDDFEDNDSNISCDSLNSSELNGSVHTDESNEDAHKKGRRHESVAKLKENNDSFLPRGLLQDIRERSAKLSPIENESDAPTAQTPHEEAKQNINENGNLSKESAELTSFRLVTQFNNDKRREAASSPTIIDKSPVISESTYEDRKRDDQSKGQLCYSGNCFDADKYYDFHLNEKHVEDVSIKSVKVSGKSGGGEERDDVEYFAGVKTYHSDEPPSTIRSSKGTIRGVKNRVRAGIATFLQIQSTAKNYKDKDTGKIVVYTTTMGIVRGTYQRCVLVKKILRNLMVKFEERDVFMSTEYQDEIRDRMKSDQIQVPQVFVDGLYIGDADAVEKLNESGELRKMLKPYKSPDACHTCQTCGGYRLLPCRICSGSKKSLHRNHFTAEFVALKCMNCDEVGLVRCEACC